MNSKKANRAFLISIILYIAVVNGAAFFLPKLITDLVVSNLLCEAAIGLPIIVFVLLSKEKTTEFLGFHKMKITTLLVIIPFTMLSSPLITLINLVSQFWVRNEAAAMMENYNAMQMPFWKLLFSIGIFAPICEEVICRGAYYRSYRKSGGMFRAMILSSLLFALVHMNLNQAMYAFAVGVLAVLLVEATGSLWASVIYHALINSSQVVLMHLSMKINPDVFSEATDIMTTDTMVLGVAGYLVITALTLPLAWALLVWISGNEGRKGTLPSVWRSRRCVKNDKMITVSLIAGVVICILMMLAVFWLPAVLRFVWTWAEKYNIQI